MAETPETGIQYDAFLSYSHAVDGRLGPQLRRELHRLARPWYGLRSMRVFLDQTNLSASPELWPSIEKALDGSRNFVLLASPDAARSKWVRKEVERWLARHRTRGLLIARTEGEIVWGGRDFDWERTDALPPALTGAFTQEPGWVDLRWARSRAELGRRSKPFLKAVAKLAAPIRGVDVEELLNEDRIEQNKRLYGVVIGAALLTTLLVLAVLFFTRSRANAERAEREALRQKETLALQYLATARERLGRAELCDSLPWVAAAIRTLDGLDGLLEDEAAGHCQAARALVGDLAHRLPVLRADWPTGAERASQLIVAPGGESVVLHTGATLSLRRTSNGNVLYERALVNRFGVTWQAFDPSGNTLALVYRGKDEHAHLDRLDARTGAPLKELELELGQGTLHDVRLDPASARLLTYSLGDGGLETVRLFDLESGRALGEPIEDGSGPDAGSQLFSARHGRAVVPRRASISLLALEDGRRLAEIDLRGSNVSKRCLIDDERGLLIVVFALGGAVVYDLETGAPHPHAITTGFSAQVAALSPDGSSLAILGQKGEGMGLAWVQVEPMRVIDSDLLPGKSYPSESLRFARDGRSIAVLYDGSLQLWSTSELGLRASSRRGRLAMKDFAYSPDGSRLAVWSGDENSSDLTRAQVFDSRGRALTPELLGCTRPAWTADGRRFLTLFEGDRVRDWELPERSAPGAPPALFRVRGRSFFGDVPLDAATGRFVVADPDVSRDHTRLRVLSLDDGLVLHELPELDFPLAQGRLAGERLWLRSVRWDRQGKPRPVDLRAWDLQSRTFVEMSQHTAVWLSRGGVAELDATGIQLRGAGGASLLHLEPPTKEVLEVEIDATGERALVLVREETSGRQASFRVGGAPTDFWSDGSGFISDASAEDGPPEVPSIGEDWMRVGSVELWDLRTGQRVPGPPGKDCMRASFSPDGGCLWLTRYVREGELGEAWDIARGQRIGNELPGIVRFDPRTEVALVHRIGDTAPQLFDVATGLPKGPPLLHAEGAIGRFARGGDLVVTRSGENLQLWSARVAQAASLPFELDASVPFFEVLPLRARERLLATTADGWVQAWDVAADERPAAEIDAWARGLAVQEVDASGRLLRVRQ